MQLSKAKNNIKNWLDVHCLRNDYKLLFSKKWVMDVELVRHFILLQQVRHYPRHL